MNEDFELIDEHRFNTLGIVASVVDKDICVFVDKEIYVKQIPNNATMGITNRILCNKVKSTNRGVCVVDNPRMFFL